MSDVLTSFASGWMARRIPEQPGGASRDQVSSASGPAGSRDMLSEFPYDRMERVLLASQYLGAS